MLFLLFGSSGAGKTASIEQLAGGVPRLAVHDFDEVGVPSDADTAWRHRANEVWGRRVLTYEPSGIDVLLAGQTPFGELLATPSASSLEAMSGCLLDCDDATRRSRIRDRATAEDQLDRLIAWAAWLRGHAHDPRHQPEVIHDPATEREMRWDRWRSWTKDDPRWRVSVIDTSTMTTVESAHEISEWIARERELLSSGRHPLRRGRIPVC